MHPDLTPVDDLPMRPPSPRRAAAFTGLVWLILALGAAAFAHTGWVVGTEIADALNG